MSDGPNESGSWSDRLLLLALILAAGAGFATWHFHGVLEDQRNAFEQAKEDYRRMHAMTPRVRRLLSVQNEKGRSGVEQDPTTYLGALFRRKSLRCSVTPQRSRPLAGWDETPFRITFSRDREELLPRRDLLEILRVVERERRDLKTRDLTLQFKDEDLEEATVVFAQYKRQ